MSLEGEPVVRLDWDGRRVNDVHIHSTRTLAASRLLVGRTADEAHCSIRFSLSHNTTEDDIEHTLAALSRVMVEKNMVRLMPCK